MGPVFSSATRRRACAKVDARGLWRLRMRLATPPRTKPTCWQGRPLRSSGGARGVFSDREEWHTFDSDDLRRFRDDEGARLPRLLWHYLDQISFRRLDLWLGCHARPPHTLSPCRTFPTYTPKHEDPHSRKKTTVYILPKSIITAHLNSPPKSHTPQTPPPPTSTPP